MNGTFIRTYRYTSYNTKYRHTDADGWFYIDCALDVSTVAACTGENN